MLTVTYALSPSPLRSASQLYVTVHQLPDAASPEGAVGEVLLSQAKEIERRQGSVELVLPEPQGQCLVVGSAFNAARQRSDTLRATAQQAVGAGG